MQVAATPLPGYEPLLGTTMYSSNGSFNCSEGIRQGRLGCTSGLTGAALWLGGHVQVRGCFLRAPEHNQLQTAKRHSTHTADQHMSCLHVLAYSSYVQASTERMLVGPLLLASQARACAPVPISDALGSCCARCACHPQGKPAMLALSRHLTSLRTSCSLHPCCSSNKFPLQDSGGLRGTQGDLQDLGDTCESIPECVALVVKPGTWATGLPGALILASCEAEWRVERGCRRHSEQPAAAEQL